MTTWCETLLLVPGSIKRTSLATCQGIVVSCLLMRTLREAKWLIQVPKACHGARVCNPDPCGFKVSTSFTTISWEKNHSFPFVVHIPSPSPPSCQCPVSTMSPVACISELPELCVHLLCLLKEKCAPHLLMDAHGALQDQCSTDYRGWGPFPRPNFPANILHLSVMTISSNSQTACGREPQWATISLFLLVCVCVCTRMWECGCCLNPFLMAELDQRSQVWRSWQCLSHWWSSEVEEGLCMHEEALAPIFWQ
jgi:hypothetical protein